MTRRPPRSPLFPYPPLFRSHVDVEHHRLDLVALLVEIAGVLDALGPGDVAHVHQAVDPLLHADEDAEVGDVARSEEHTSELQSQSNLVCRLLLEKKKSTSQK